MIWVLLALVALIVLGFWLYKRSPRLSDRGTTGILLMVLPAIALIVLISLLGFNRMVVYSEIQEYYAVEKTLEKARQHNKTWETAAIQMKVSEMNQWRASIIYWNSTVFDSFIPDEVEKLEEIE